MSKKNQPSEPPQPPTVARKLQFHILQLVGIPFLMLVPVLALFGLFGETRGSTTVSSPHLEMRVEYPTRFRYKMIDSISVRLLNTSPEPLAAVQVRFDSTYMDRFSTVVFTPAVQHITNVAYVVEVNDLQPGETRMILVGIQAEEYGEHEGGITVTVGDAQEVQATVNTFTFP